MTDASEKTAPTVAAQTVELADGDAALDGGESAPEAVGSEDVGTTVDGSTSPRGRARAARVLVFGLLPALTLLLALGAGYLKYRAGDVAASALARTQSVQAATESTVAILSYEPDKVEADLDAARDRLTGTFRDSYGSLIRDVVIPGAKQQNVSAVATVSAAASVSASEKRAVVLVFVDQTTTIGNGAPTSTASCVRVTLDKVGSRWLISDFTPT